MLKSVVLCYIFMEMWYIFQDSLMNRRIQIDYIVNVFTVTFDQFKEIVHPKIKILSFTQPQIVPNLYEILSFFSVEHIRRYSEEC